jgi:hypothetical protein
VYTVAPANDGTIFNLVPVVVGVAVTAAMAC